MTRVLIDASNLVAGGGIQVASAHLQSVDRRIADSPQKAPAWLRTADVFISPEVAETLPKLTALTPIVQHRRWRLRHPLSLPYEAIHTIFGPTYTYRHAPLEIMGYADVTSVYPTLTEVERDTIRRRLRTRLSRQSAGRTTALITETSSLANQMRKMGIETAHWYVVPNTIHPAFCAPVDEGVVDNFRNRIPKHSTNFLYATRNYPHKNIPAANAICAALEKLGHAARTIVTLTGSEWQSLENSRSHLINLGPMVPAQLPPLYRACNAVLLPSLREAASATPLEAMATGTPLFAAARDYFREASGDAATYFEPYQVEQAARTILNTLTDTDVLHDRVSRGRQIMDAWPTPEQRSDQYIEIMDELIQARPSSGYRR